MPPFHLPVVLRTVVLVAGKCRASSLCRVAEPCRRAPSTCALLAAACWCCVQEELQARIEGDRSREDARRAKERRDALEMASVREQLEQSEALVAAKMQDLVAAEASLNEFKRLSARQKIEVT